MHRIDDPSAAPGNLFTEGVPGLTPATVVTDDWANAVQEQIARYIESRSIVLNKSNDDQLTEAIEEHVSSVASTAGDNNLLVNPEFEYWQRSDGVAVALAPGVRRYTADQWAIEPDDTGQPGDGTATQGNFTPGQLDVPGSQSHFMTFEQTVAAVTHSFMSQPMEDVRRFSAQELTISFWARVNTGTLDVTPSFVQVFGEGATGSSDVETTGTAITVDSTWTRYEQTVTVPTISGLTVSATERHFCEFRMNFETGGTFVVSIANVKVEMGASSTPYFSRPVGLEFLRCLRYYETSFPPQGGPQSDSFLTAQVVWHPDTATVAVPVWVPFKVPKWVPNKDDTSFDYQNAFGMDVRIYNDSGGVGSAHVTNAAQTRVALSIAGAGANSPHASAHGIVQWSWTGDPTAGAPGFFLCEFHWSVDTAPYHG